ncbi:MAG: KpsF/GutQ family sugar-phosphate isomerase [Alphaproteobacteria bacterium]|jgi:arabinose-5-phosphate isomerase|nr:KpsF/GutQ family sugar-phosphate isomerase [Alphaproteobacteria bacterium]
MFTSEQILNLGKKIIQTELEGIALLRDNLSVEFTHVCNLLLNNKGRVIITGMGKSGHIGAKIAATLASTGTSSIFVHPAEALHGDLGMIEKNDIVIALSNSGNTVELQGIINYTQRFNIPLIAITSNKDSELGKNAKYVLELPKASEACSLGLAPTTSTTNTLILGDAIAITLLEMKGFSAEDFRVFHPGGSLGSKLLKIADIMHQGNDVPLVKSDVSMDKAIIAITSHKFGCVGILNNSGEIIGIITDGDIRRHMSSDFLHKKVDEVMTKNFVSITQDTNTSKALLAMENNKVTNLFVIEDKKPVGIIHIHDLLKLGVM